MEPELAEPGDDHLREGHRGKHLHLPLQIIDVFKCQTIRVLDNILYFEWRYFDQFITMDNNYFINLYQIDVDKPIMSFKADVETNLIKFNLSKSLLATFSKVLNNIKIWSFQSDQYIFEITDDQKLNNFCWCSSRNVFS